MTLVQQLLKEYRSTIASRPTVFTGRKALFLVGGPENWTLRPESLVETKDGMRPLSAIQKGDKLLRWSTISGSNLPDADRPAIASINLQVR